MANARKCDRCGDYYDENTKYVVGPASCYPHYVSGISTLKSLGFDYETKLDTAYDLCDKCIESFQDWLRCENAVES